MITRSKSKMGDITKLYELLKEVKDDLKNKASNERIDILIDEIKKKDEKIQNLENRVEILESKVSVLQNTVNLLERKADDNEQYSRRLCLRVSGIPVSEGREDADKCLEQVKSVVNQINNFEINEFHYDRAHRIGQGKANSDGVYERQMIVKFVSFRSRTNLYKNRKALGNHRLYLDLTKRRFDLLMLAKKKIIGNILIDFVFADINCKLCTRLKDGKFKYFSSEVELDQLVNSLMVE